LPSLGDFAVDENKKLIYQSKVANAISSTIRKEELDSENLRIQLNYKIIEANCDLIPYLINAGTIALTTAGIMQKSILTATTLVK